MYERNKDRSSPSKSSNDSRPSPTGKARDGGILGTYGTSSSPLKQYTAQQPNSGRLGYRHAPSQPLSTSSAASTQQAGASSPSGGSALSRPVRNSAPGDGKHDFKSQSFSSGSSAVYQALRRVTPASALATAEERKSPTAELARRSATVPFRMSLSLSHSASLPAPAGRIRSSSSMPTENSLIIDDITFTFGHSSFQGQRDYQEDTVSVYTTSSSFLGGVFDGHGGDEVSKELERVLLQNINQRVAEAHTRNPDDVRAVEAAIRSAYVSTNEEIAARLDKAQDAGSCAVTALIKRVAGKTYLFCANAGDCRAVLYTQGANGTNRAVRLSEDHKPHPNVCPSEITRICDAGGCVLWGRVQGCLAVSRAFGDRTLQPFVIADPHVEARPLDPDKDMFIYLASDGVTDMVDDLQGCTLIADQLHRGCTTQQAAAALVSAAFHKGSCDNISVLVLRVRPRAAPANR